MCIYVFAYTPSYKSFLGFGFSFYYKCSHHLLPYNIITLLECISYAILFVSLTYYLYSYKFVPLNLHHHLFFVSCLASCQYFIF